MKQINSLHQEVLNEVKAFHKSESRILDLLQRIDNAQLYLEVGYPSLFKYAVGYLKLSEAQAWAFMTVARKSKEVPELKEQIEAGELSVSTARRIVPVLEKSNHSEWIEKARTLTKSDLEREVAKISPHAFKKKEVIRAISGTDSSVRFQIPEEKLKKWKRMQTLMMSKKRKTLDLMSAIDALVEDFLRKEDPLEVKNRVIKCEKTEAAPKPEGNPQKFPSGFDSDVMRTTIPGPSQVRVVKRTLSSRLRKEVLKRDKGQCQFTAPTGVICKNEVFVQIHHLQPWAMGGRHELENLQTLCSAHHSFKHSYEQRISKFPKYFEVT